MKKNLSILFVLLFASMDIAAQHSDNNFIYTAAPQKPVKVEDLNTLVPEEVIENVTYFDGLGRPMQTVGIRAGVKSDGSAVDIITHIGYDGFGRQDKEYLPYTDGGNNGIFRAWDIDLTTKYYYTQHYPSDINSNSPNPYSQKEFEPSPLDRVLKQAAPGSDWAMGSGHEIKLDYQTNQANDEVKNFGVSLTFADNTYTPTLTQSSLNNGYYDKNELYKTVTYDENTDVNPMDETKGSTVEFKNKDGQVILKRTYGIVGDGTANERHDTYYVYDDYGNLTYVLPPKANASSADLTTINSILSHLCYQYKYDYKNRLVEKKLPGKETESIVYNNLDKAILTQDAVQKAKGQWLFTKYDAFGRVAYTGKAVSSTKASRVAIQDEVKAFTGALWVTQSTTASNFGETNIYYNNGAYPSNNGALIDVSEIFTINYYDAYVNRPAGVPSSIIIMESPTNESNTENVKGLLTTSKVKVLDAPGANVWITKLNYYDKKARPIYTYADNSYLGTVDIAETKLDFVGKPLKTKTTHIKDEVTIAVLDNFTYDHAGRLKAHTQCIGDSTMGYVCPGNQDLRLTGAITGNQVSGGSITVTSGTISPPTTLSINPVLNQELISYNNYDELGQLIDKKVGGIPTAVLKNSKGLQTVDYTYNIRGWLKGINDVNTIGSDLFAFKINYNDIADISKKLFNGNISQTFWKTANNDPGIKNYTYTYDDLNRLTLAESQDMGRYNESLRYDKNGNIMSLIRNGFSNVNPDDFGTMDILAYDYNAGNRLMKVTDSSGSTEGFKDGNKVGDDYGYDANGNMTKDLNKGIGNSTTDGIVYNHLNLPTQITFATGNIQYVYDATGVKLEKKVVENGKSDVYTKYAGSYIYEKIGIETGTDVLKFFSQPEGYISYNSGAFDYIYQYKDHLGNVRLSYDKNLAIVEENNYYPFGLKQKGYLSTPNYSYGNPQAEKYKYNGKELQDELGLNFYDYGARNYDPALGRWMNIDPLAEKGKRFSPYVYALNNPIFFVDPDGMLSDAFINDLWQKSGNNTKWTNNDDGTFSSDNNKTAEYQEDEKSKATELKGNYSNMVNKARKDGHNMAADNLQRWLNGTGGTKIISNGWLRSNREVVSGEDRNIERFQEQLQQLGEGLEDGQSANLNDYWDTLVTGGVFGELYYASGTSTLTSKANFKVTRKGSSIVISGSITHTWSDTYDWHAGASAYIPGFGNIDDSDAKLVEKHCGAKPFEMQGAWKQSFNKSYELGFFGGLNVNLK